LPENNYTVFVKLRYSQDSFMYGPQFGFNYKKYINLADFHDKIMNKLSLSFDKYSIPEEDLQYKINFKVVYTKLQS
jgi:hypothetical protein